MKRYAVIVPILLLVLAPSFLAAQTSQQEDDGLQSTMEKLAKDAARSYISPIVSGFGTNLNSGWFHRAPWANMFGFDLEFGVVGMATIFQEENKTFSSTGEFKFNFDQADKLAQAATANPTFQAQVRQAIQQQTFQVSFSGPTVVGKKTDSLRVGFQGRQITVNGNTFTLPTKTFALPVTGVLEELPALPLGAPQLTFGTILGTQFTFRYLPNIKLDDKIGEIKYFGFGIQHNPMVWFGEDALPFELGIGYFSQSLNVGSLMEAKATAFGVNGSIRLGWGFLNLTPYFGFMSEKSSIAFAYDYEITDLNNQVTKQRVTFDATGENTSRLTFGASIKILLINVNADINLGKYKAISGGIMFII